MTILKQFGPTLGTLRTWHSIQSFIDKHNLPYKVQRFNMSNRGVMVDSVSGEVAANTVREAEEICKFTAAEFGTL